MQQTCAWHEEPDPVPGSGIQCHFQWQQVYVAEQFWCVDKSPIHVPSLNFIGVTGHAEGASGPIFLWPIPIYPPDPNDAETTVVVRFHEKALCRRNQQAGSALSSRL